MISPRTFHRVIVLAVALTLTFGDTSALAARGDLSLTGLQGNVQVQAAGAVSWSTATDGQSISEGDAIRTSAGALAIIKMDKVGELVLADESELVISKNQIAGKIIDTELNLKLGNLKGDLGKLPKGSNFKMVTPTSVAAVRGTIFLIVVTIAGIATNYVYSGSMAVAALTGGNVEPQIISNGQAAQVTSQGVTIAPAGSPQAAAVVAAFQQIAAKQAGVEAAEVEVQVTVAPTLTLEDLEEPEEEVEDGTPTT